MLEIIAIILLAIILMYSIVEHKRQVKIYYKDLSKIQDILAAIIVRIQKLESK